MKEQKILDGLEKMNQDEMVTALREVPAFDCIFCTYTNTCLHRMEVFEPESLKRLMNTDQKLFVKKTKSAGDLAKREEERQLYLLDYAKHKQRCLEGQRVQVRNQVIKVK